MEEDPDLFIHPNREYPNKPRRMRELTSDVCRLMETLGDWRRRRTHSTTQEARTVFSNWCLPLTPTAARLRRSRRSAVVAKRYEQRLNLHMQLRHWHANGPSPPSPQSPATSTAVAPSEATSLSDNDNNATDNPPIAVSHDPAEGAGSSTAEAPDQDGGGNEVVIARSSRARNLQTQCRTASRRNLRIKNWHKSCSKKRRANAVKGKSDNRVPATPNKIIKINLRTNEKSSSSGASRLSNKTNINRERKGK